MGRLVKVKKKLGSMDYGVFYSVLILLSVGIVMVYSASSYYAMFRYKNSSYFLTKQAFIALLGIGTMILFMNFDYHKLKKVTRILMIVTIPLLLAVYFFPATNGAQRWIKIGSLTFQPSELAKYVVVLYLAKRLSERGDKIKDFWKEIVPDIAVAGFYAGLVLAQKNLSIASLIMIVSFIMLFSAGGRIKHLFGYVFPVLLSAALAFALIPTYRRKRMLNFINPWKDASGNGYQLVQSFYALGAGGLLGLGLGQSRQKTLYMPEPHNDFIFSIIGEELGLVGCLAILCVFGVLIWRGIKVALNARDTYGMLLALGITSVIAVQTIINIAVVTGSMPVTGVPLPFISYGGTSLLITMSAMGVLLNISRQKKS
ncbi:cell division protein FtsW [Clostridium sp. DSM 8431]|uniref:stage V sporulation protein E n=1 Tax=Clostridium sp. DSM 8431 TaxID=1761781 RepID=UPI0008E5B3C9|nr:stage V sporulation protein E [Clostridium sp. DSM 8431]SFU28438.1 cell division protein FtsW [Clostridium sp. DSM 8431]